jgi:hypothetical protein
MDRFPDATIKKIQELRGFEAEKATYIMLDSDHFVFPVGTLLILVADYGDRSPFFRPKNDLFSHARAVYLHRLALYDATNPEHVAFRTKLRLLNAFNDNSRQGGV